MFNLCVAFETSIFLRENDWHFISDVTSLSYVCCLLVHLRAGIDEHVNQCLRYAAFALAWIFKVRDGWDSGAWEAVLIGAFAFVFALEVLGTGRIGYYKSNTFFSGILTLLVALGCFYFEQEHQSQLIIAVGHILSGFALWSLWGSVPSLDIGKKFDDLPR